MNKNKIKLVGCALVGISVAATLASCGFNKGEDDDSTKTQIYVSSFCRGFGGEWLTNYKKEFEALHENDSYETGKKGVQVVIRNDLTPAEDLIGQIKGNKYEIYFTEQTDYYKMLVMDEVGDLTDCVKGKIAGEDKSIEDKMSADQKAFMNVNGKYYGIPHYTGYVGLTYDVDLFNSKYLYFAKSGGFVTSTNTEKSAGPDGQLGTKDDGLPVTYDDFIKLCNTMVARNIIPFTIPSEADYNRLFINSMVATNVGFDQMNLCYTCDGTLTDLISVDDAGNVTPLSDQAITTANGDLFHKKRGKYEALKMYKKLVDTYLPSDFKSSGYTVDKSHYDFLSSNISGENPSLEGKPIAMIAEGNWWVNESGSLFADLATKHGDQYSKANRNLSYMPLPRASENAENATNTIFDHLSAISFIKKDVAEWKKPLINEFLQFCNSDASLVSFSVATNTTKALNYTIPEADLAKMSPYGRSLYEYQQKSKMVRPYANTDFYRSNATMFKVAGQYKAIIDTLTVDSPATYLKNGTSAEKYFNGIISYFDKNWPGRK